MRRVYRTPQLQRDEMQRRSWAFYEAIKTGIFWRKQMTPKFCLTIAACVFFLVPTLADAYQISLSPSVAISEEYNDNIFLTPDNEEDDFITTVTPGFTVELTQRENGLSLSYNPGFSFFADHSDLNSWQHEAVLSAWMALTRSTRIELEDAFLYTEDPAPEGEILSPITEDPLIQRDPTIRRGREPYYPNTSSIRLIQQFGSSDSFYLQYAYTVLRNDDPEVEDIDQHIPTLGITYWFLPRWGLELEGSLTRTESDESDNLDQWSGRITQTYRVDRQFEAFVQYDHTVVKYQEHEDEGSIDYQVFEPSIGITYHPRDDYLLSLRLGYFKEDRDAGENVDGPSGDIELTKTLRNGSISLTASAGQENTILNAENLGFTKFYEVGCEFEYQILRNLAGDISASYRNAVFEETETNREDDIVGAGVGLTYAVTTWLSTRLGYSYQVVNSLLPEDEYEENSVLFQITLAPRPYRWVK
jgi:predicted porin